MKPMVFYNFKFQLISALDEHIFGYAFGITYCLWRNGIVEIEVGVSVTECNASLQALPENNLHCFFLSNIKSKLGTKFYQNLQFMKNQRLFSESHFTTVL